MVAARRLPVLRPSWWIAQVGLLVLAGYNLRRIAGCLGACYADIEALYGARIGGLSFPDMQLNSWILAWGQRALASAPGSFFDANAFHPAEAALTGSEHMLGVSIVLLPTILLGPGAVWLHQAATLLSYLIMGWTTFALARWITRSDWAAFVAAATAMFMPWRLFELAHVQLLSAHWIPLVWLLIAKIGTGEATRRTAPLLAIVLLIQLTSSYYVAYFVSASIGVLALVLLLRHGFRLERAIRLGAALLGAYVPFALVSLPYLQRDAGSDLVLAGGSDQAVGLAEVATFLLGQSYGTAGEVARLTYHVPLCILLFAVLGAVLARLGPPSSDPAGRRLGTVAIALWSIALTGVVLWVGGAPARIASDWIPGFEHLRAAARWLILVGIAAPPLAAIGVYRVEQLLVRGGRARARVGFRALVVAVLLLEMPWGTIPVRPVGLAGGERPYEVLRDLQPGPVLEIPWPGGMLREAGTGSRYMLASTLHWKPILNGFAPYPPRTYDFLHRLAWRLPSQDALDKLTRLAGLRWLVLHVDQIAAQERTEWQRLIDRAVLRRAFEDPATWVLEVVDQSEANSWLEAMASPAHREETLTGMPRDRVVVSRGSGRLDVEVPEIVSPGVLGEAVTPIGIRIDNGTPVGWPGLDIQTDGLVQLRYEFVDDHGTVVAEGLVPLYADVPANGSLATVGFLEPPQRPGEYRLQMALVQRDGRSFEELELPDVERRVIVSPRAAHSM